MSDDDGDVVALLLRQHTRIRGLFDQVAAEEGERRAETFRELTRLLVAHETAEEEVLHPFARQAFEGGADVVAARLKEERAADRVLARLADMGTDNPEFTPLLNELRQDVLAHAEAEERHEFNRVQAVADTAQLTAMAAAVRAAEAAAPALPRSDAGPGAKEALRDRLSTLSDRVRDAARRVQS
jgi:hemerythrin superfamily protein